MKSIKIKVDLTKRVLRFVKNNDSHYFTITAVVKAGSKKGPLVQPGPEGCLMIFVRERAVDGAANKAVVALTAAHFGVAKSCVEIVHGQGAQYKQIRINDTTAYSRMNSV